MIVFGEGFSVGEMLPTIRFYGCPVAAGGAMCNVIEYPRAAPARCCTATPSGCAGEKVDRAWLQLSLGGPPGGPPVLAHGEAGREREDRNDRSTNTPAQTSRP